MRYSTLILGPSGTGKSTAASSVADLPDVERTLVCCCKGRERSSFGYQQRLDKLDIEIYEDPRWRPSLNRFEADAHMKLLTRLDGLLEDDIYDAVVIDPFTDAALNIEHEILKPMEIGSPGELADSFAFYGQLKSKADELVRAAIFLTTAAVRPKHVIMTMHVQPPKEDSVYKGVKKTSADKVARGIEYEGSVLPMIDGAYRRKMAGDFDLVIYTGFDESYFDKKLKKQVKNFFYLQVSPDRDRHSKIAVAPVLLEDKIANNFEALMKAVESNGK
jgi:hypothetical protein